MRFESRPLSLAEIFDTAFQLVQAEWRALIGLSLIVQIPIVLISIAAPWLFDASAESFGAQGDPTAGISSELVTVIAGLGLLYLLLYPLISAAVTAAAGHGYLERRFELRDAVRAGLGSLFPMLGAYFIWFFTYFFLVGVVLFAAMAFGAAVLAALTEIAGTVGMLIAGILGVAIGGVLLFWMLFAAVVSALLPSIVVLESRSAVAAVRRAMTLGATAKRRVVGVMLITGIIVGVPVLGAQMMIDATPGLTLFVWAAFQAIGFAFSATVSVVLYFDLRCRAGNFALKSTSDTRDGSLPQP